MIFVLMRSAPAGGVGLPRSMIATLEKLQYRQKAARKELDEMTEDVASICKRKKKDYTRNCFGVWARTYVGFLPLQNFDTSPETEEDTKTAEEFSMKKIHHQNTHTRTRSRLSSFLQHFVKRWISSKKNFRFSGSTPGVMPVRR